MDFDLQLIDVRRTHRKSERVAVKLISTGSGQGADLRGLNRVVAGRYGLKSKLALIVSRRHATRQAAPDCVSNYLLEILGLTRLWWRAADLRIRNHSVGDRRTLLGFDDSPGHEKSLVGCAELDVDPGRLRSTSNQH